MYALLELTVFMFINVLMFMCTEIRIGFDPIIYSFEENVGTATLTIRKFLSPGIDTMNRTVVFSTEDGSAMG